MYEWKLLLKNDFHRDTRESGGLFCSVIDREIERAYSLFRVFGADSGWRAFDVK